MRRIACLLSAVIVVLGVVGAGPARADVYDDNPATASPAPGKIYVFARAAGGDILERHRAGGEWTPWTSLGGNSTSGPAAVAFGGTVHVFVRGPDGAVWQSWLQPDGSWHNWVSLGGLTLSAPGASVRRGVGYLDLVVLGTDSQLYHQSYVPGTGWSGFAPIGGVLTSAAAVNSQSDNVLNIWARGTDAAMYQKSWAPSAGWMEWSNLGGGLIGAPSSISRMADVINVYARGAGNATYQRGWTPGVWSPWAVLDSTPIASTPVAGADASNHEYVFARVGTGELAFKEWIAGKGWYPWSNLGPIAVPSPPPATTTPPPVTAPIQDGQADLQTGVRCTPPGGRLRVSVSIKKPKGKSKPRVTKIVFYTKGKGRKVRVDSKAPFQVRIPINRPAGAKGRVYARVYYKRSARGKVHRKVVSRRYTVCR